MNYGGPLTVSSGIVMGTVRVGKEPTWATGSLVVSGRVSQHHFISVRTFNQQGSIRGDNVMIQRHLQDRPADVPFQGGRRGQVSVCRGGKGGNQNAHSCLAVTGALPPYGRVWGQIWPLGKCNQYFPLGPTLWSTTRCPTSVGLRHSR